MNGAGLFLATAGVWVLTQILAGDALDRLAIFGHKTADGAGDATSNVIGDAAKAVVPQIPFIGPLIDAGGKVLGGSKKPKKKAAQ